MECQTRGSGRTTRMIETAIKFALTQSTPQTVLIVCANEAEKRRIGEWLAAKLNAMKLPTESLNIHRQPGFQVVLTREQHYYGRVPVATFTFETMEWYHSDKRRGHTYSAVYFDHYCYEVNRVTYERFDNKAQHDEMEKYWKGFTLTNTAVMNPPEQVIIGKLDQIIALLQTVAKGIGEL